MDIIISHNFINLHSNCPNISTPSSIKNFIIPFLNPILHSLHLPSFEVSLYVYGNSVLYLYLYKLCGETNNGASYNIFEHVVLSILVRIEVCKFLRISQESKREKIRKPYFSVLLELLESHTEKSFWNDTNPKGCKKSSRESIKSPPF